MARVLLLSMPFSAAHYPNLALGLLKPAAEAAGYDCDVRYFSLDYIRHVGVEAYALIADPRAYMAQAGEWVFAGAANDSQDIDDSAFLTDVFAAELPELHTPQRLLALLAARDAAPDFIEACFRAVDWAAYAVVGFTSSFQQTMATLALARRVRAAHPGLFIVVGGANCQDEMGVELLRRYPFLDAVCLGEGDLVFPELLRRLAAGASLEGLAGVAWRRADGAVAVPAVSSVAVTDMDALPLPDFDAFFDQHRGHDLGALYPPAIVFETARGCWWGARQHCTFCGLNGVTMAFRAKSQERAFDELAGLVARHGVRDVANADNILEMRYFERFIPRLGEAGLGLLIYYETRANLQPRHMVALARAGIRRIQAGIETLDTALLRLMRKGTTALQNVQALKLAAEAGIYVEWLALWGFPGETADSYRAIAALVPKLVHLQPPSAFLRVRADRFSPYFRDPAGYGVTLAPLPAYRHLFPFDDAAISRLGYHWSMHSECLDHPEPAMADVGAAYAGWRAGQPASALWMEADGDVLMVHEERQGWPAAAMAVEGAAAALLGRCAQIVLWPAVLAELGDAFGQAALTAAADDLAARGWLLREGAALLALPLRQPGFRRAPSWAEIRSASLERAA